MSKEYKAAMFIGRFQPFHKGHLEIIEYGLKIADKVIILVGSANCARNIKNPFTFEERENFILSAFEQEDLDRIEIEPLRDAYYSENTWVTDVQNKVRKYVNEGDTVALLGNYKDSSSYYLKSFPQWEFVPVKNKTQVDATQIRDALFGQKKVLKQYLTPYTTKFLSAMLKDIDPTWSDFPKHWQEVMEHLITEHQFIKDYKAKHTWADQNIPYAPIFVTVDAVVICSGHVLVVRRKFDPGKGLIALPGGFIRANEKIEDAAIRELKEETGIKVDKIILQSSISEMKVFDHPDRSLRGRTVTHAYCIRLKDGTLPEVRGGDDAEKAYWIALADIKDEQFYEDHCHIIRYFVNRN